jgi:hypothetical protein
MKITVTEKLISTKEISDLDFSFYDDIVYDPEEDELEMNYSDVGWTDGYQISISTLIQHLQILEKKGATYVKIDNDVDHHGYVIEGYHYKVEKNS